MSFITTLRHRYGAKFLVPDWEDKVNSGIGLSYRTRQATDRLHDGGPERQPYAGVN
jgi:hypothetical protein